MSRWHTALAFALTGQELSLVETDAPDAARLVGELAQAGWGASEVREHALDVVAREMPWPHQIPDALRVGLGAAQLYAALGQVRSELGVLTLEVKGPSTRTRLDADERRLMAEVPPHHVLHT